MARRTISKAEKAWTGSLNDSGWLLEAGRATTLYGNSNGSLAYSARLRCGPSVHFFLTDTTEQSNLAVRKYSRVCEDYLLR
jgi:predicted Zn-dependent protease